MDKATSESSHPNACVRVSTPARLHLGFLDLNGSTGRKFGSIGVAINTHHTVINARPANTFAVSSDVASVETCQRVKVMAENFYQTIGKNIPIINREVVISIIQSIPEHAGLGSGTQLALATYTALAKLHQIPISTREIATQSGRGARSGIGIATFEHGGFVVDGGLQTNQKVPPLLFHQQFPRNWRIVLILDHNHQGIHGQQEKTAFNKLPEFPIQNAQAICHLTLMKLLPALIEQNIDSFGHAITGIQALVGDHFAPAQGGRRYTSRDVARVLQHAQSLGHQGIAQSSWGPTGCIFVENEATATTLISDLTAYSQSKMVGDHNLTFVIAEADEKGANIETGTA